MSYHHCFSEKSPWSYIWNETFKVFNLYPPSVLKVGHIMTIQSGNMAMMGLADVEISIG